MAALFKLLGDWGFKNVLQGIGSLLFNIEDLVCGDYIYFLGLHGTRFK